MAQIQKLPPGPMPLTLTARPAIRTLGDHAQAFLNVNNPHGWPAEPVVPEATHAAPLRVNSKSYEIGQALLNTARDPGRIDAVETDLPKPLLERFLVTEAKSAQRKEALEQAEQQRRQRVENHQLQVALAALEYRQDVLQEVRDAVLWARYPHLDPVISGKYYTSVNLFRNHMFGTRSHFSFRMNWKDLLFEPMPLQTDEYFARREQLHREHPELQQQWLACNLSEGADQ